MTSAGLCPEYVRSVFACSGGDTEALDNICISLASPGRPVSPGQFNNSVHNAPAGYWSIATGSHAASTSLGAYDASFVAGCLDAATVSLQKRTGFAGRVRYAGAVGVVTVSAAQRVVRGDSPSAPRRAPTAKAA